jgi:hypothetical protein
MTTYENAKAKIIHRHATTKADTRNEFFGSVREAVLAAIAITDKPDRELRTVALEPFEDDKVSLGKGALWDYKFDDTESLFKLLDKFDDMPPPPTNPDNYSAWGEF